jgi:glycosyltransferase involved in cell wall biosynthesis
MKICLVVAFPPSNGPLNEYGLHVARELQRNPRVELTILADELADYGYATDANGKPVSTQRQELPGFNVIRCWKVGSATTPVRLLNTIRELKPDVVWFNLVFSSFGTQANPWAAFAGLSAPALTRAAGFYTHITLHQVIENVDLAAAGVRMEKIYRMGTAVATRALLKAHSVSVLLSGYRRTLMTKYSAENVLLGTHGIFSAISGIPDFSKRGNPEHRVLAFGNWGTYKRLEALMEAFPSVLKKVPNARLIVAGANHPARPGYWESIRDAQPTGLPIEFRGYIPRQDVAELFRTSSVLVMPYDSATGSSGPAHQACEYGVPIVCADIPDFREMAADEDMAVSFFKTGDPVDLSERLSTILQSPEVLTSMAERNFAAGIQMTMESVVQNYLRWFELKKCKRALLDADTLLTRFGAWLRPLFSTPAGILQSDSFVAGGDDANGDGRLESTASNVRAIEFAHPIAWRKSEGSEDISDFETIRALEPPDAAEQQYG